MSTNLSFERQLATWMAGEAAVGVPAGAIDDALSTTSRLQPRPRWLALLRESPMSIDARVAVGSPPRRLALAAAVTLLLLAGAFVAGSYLLRTPGALADWPTFRGGFDRSGASLLGPVGGPTMKWQTIVQGVSNSVSVVRGTVYVATDQGEMKALDLLTGHQRWTYVPTEQLGGLIGPSIVDDLAYVFNDAGTLFAVDIGSGKERWKSTDRFPGPGPVTYGLGRVYTGTNDGQVAAFDATSGSVAWRWVAPSGGAMHTAAFADGRVYIAADTPGDLYAIDAASGKLAWQLDLGAVQPGTTVVADGIVYSGMGEDRTTAHLRAVDAKTGVILWEKPEHYQAPAVSNGVAYVTDNSGLVAALRTSDGSELWRTHVPADSRAPAVANGVVYVATITPGHVYAFDAATGGALWDIAVSQDVTCCVEVTNGLVFAPGQDGELFAIGGDQSQ